MKPAAPVTATSIHEPIPSAPMRTSRAIRAAAWAVVAAGIAAPLVRRRVRAPALVVIGVAAAAPPALCVARARTPARDVAVCLLQMWAYVAAYEMPHDDPQALERRVRVDYPVRIDRVLGLGVLPGIRLQRRASRPGAVRRYEKVLVWCHWLWFLVPHSTLAFILLRDRERLPRAAVLTYAVFDLGAIGYWVVPTAPPWYAAAHGRLEDGSTPAVRRMMWEYGEEFWGERWSSLYDLLGGNPLAAMPSLHFATSVMAAHLLAEVGPVPGLAGWSYALTLGLALVYLGEHYVIDLLGGLALTEAVRHHPPGAAVLARRVSRGLQVLEARARG
jgi:membrane-associated phospholipid phosphatase